MMKKKKRTISHDERITVRYKETTLGLMECLRKYKLESGSDFTAEGMVQPQDSRDGWDRSGAPGQTIGNPLIANKVQGLSTLVQ